MGMGIGMDRPATGAPNSRGAGGGPCAHGLTAPVLDSLLLSFHKACMDQTSVTDAVKEAMAPLFDAFSILLPLKKNEEARSIWLRIPRGTVEDYAPYMDPMDERGAEACWREEYPHACSWYELILVDSRKGDGSVRFRSVRLGGRSIACDFTGMEKEPRWTDGPAIQIMRGILPAVKESMGMAEDGAYNDMVAKELPYQFRTGVIKRSSLWAIDHGYRENDMDGMKEETVTEFRRLLSMGVNDAEHIGRMRVFTAGDFFRACAIGYRSCGYDDADPEDVDALPSLYLRHADGRDEGLTEAGYGLDKGPGVDRSSPAAWDEWYFRRRRSGGHPWEVVRGGNSTHVDLYVCHDKDMLSWQHAVGRMDDAAYAEAMQRAGYYFQVAGLHRPFEAVNFYVAISAAGLPVILRDADAILARLDGADYVGIVPHSVVPRYCGGMFPQKYGEVVDCMHVYEDEIGMFLPYIEWLPEEPASIAKRKG